MPIRQAHDQKPFGPEFIEGAANRFTAYSLTFA
jgi:hypothetical protein